MSLRVERCVQVQQERCAHTGGSPAKGHKDNEGIGILLLSDAERAGTV